MEYNNNCALYTLRRSIPHTGHMHSVSVNMICLFLGFFSVDIHMACLA
jgi:hypothetical protein